MRSRHRSEFSQVSPRRPASIRSSSHRLSTRQRLKRKNLLKSTSLTIGCNNVFGQDPPKAYGGGGSGTGYPGFIYDATGRFVYVTLTKKCSDGFDLRQTVSFDQTDPRGVVLPGKDRGKGARGKRHDHG